MTKTEEVARAMFSTWRETMIRDGDDVAGSFEALDDKERAFALMQAKTAIEAMRVLTGEMLRCGHIPLCPAFEEEADAYGAASRVWEAMISAALKDEPG